MASRALEQRVATLEAQVEELLADRSKLTKDWRRTIGAFTDDEDMKQILRDAMRLREADRKKTRITRTTKGKKP